MKLQLAGICHVGKRSTFVDDQVAKIAVNRPEGTDGTGKILSYLGTLYYVCTNG